MRDQETALSPRVESLAWGEMVVAGLGAGKDFKLYPGGGREWDWNETGMRHRPGIRPVDVTELLDHDVTDVVLSQGMDGMLQIDPATVDFLAGRGVTVHIERTRRAVEVYNELATSTRVAGLFHSTC